MLYKSVNSFVVFIREKVRIINIKNMGLSTDTLLHQTEFKNLRKILSNKFFKTSYSKETFDCKEPKMISSKGNIFYFPMICFSEIPISSLHNHLYRYGNCIIGMKKEWAISNRMNQVHYYQKESVLMDSLIEIYNRYYLEVMERNNKNEDILDVFHHLEYQIVHSKNYSGKVETKDFEDENYFFSEEKEWRSVPKNIKRGVTLSIHPDYFKKNKERLQKKIGKKTLPFELSDIRFLILDSDEQKEEIIQLLYKLDSTCHINIFTNEEVKLNFLGYKNTSFDFYQLKKENQMLREKFID